MKNLFLALMVGFFPLSDIFAQTIQNKPEGVGKFKINKTDISIIQEIEKELGMKCKKVSNKKEQALEKEKEFYFIELSDSITSHVHCLKVRIFEIKTYKISNIDFQQLMLVFYNNKLVTLNSQANEQIEQAFRLKYQGSKSIAKREKTDCDRFFENSYSYEIWENNDISTVLLYSHFKDNLSCKETYDFSLYIFSKLYNKKEEACLKELVKRMEAIQVEEELKSRKKELEKIKDF